jgi:hypothetical protein
MARRPWWLSQKRTILRQPPDRADRPCWLAACDACRTQVREREVRSGAAMLVLRDLDRAVQQGRGPGHGAHLHPLPGGPPGPAGHPARPHDPGQPSEQWGCPIDGCERWFLGPWEVEGHAAVEHPGWTATYAARRRRLTLPTPCRWCPHPPPAARRLGPGRCGRRFAGPQRSRRRLAGETGPPPGWGRARPWAPAGYRRGGSSRRTPKCR